MRLLMEPLARLFSTPARLRMLRLFCFNDSSSFTLDEIASRIKSPKAATRKEVTVLVAADIIEKKSAKNGESVYVAVKRQPLFDELKQFLLTTTTIDNAHIIAIMRRAGQIKLLILSGIFTDALEAAADILIVGDKLDERVIASAVRLIEADLGRELRYATFETAIFKYRLGVYDRLMRDILDFPHETLVDKLGIDKN